MFKKQFMLVLLTLLAVLSADAATWKMHGTFVASKTKNVYDIGDKVYYVDISTLFVYDKASQTTIGLNKQNLLSDMMVDQIYFDSERRLLFVAYSNSNIDVIDESGKVTNISNIKDVTPRVHDCTLDNGELANNATYTTKTINDITFADGMAYVAIGYGYVTIDETTLTVKNSYELGQSLTVNSVAVVGDEMLLVTDGYLYYGPKGQDDPIHTYAKKSGTFSGSKLYPYRDNAFFMLRSNALYRYDMVDSEPTGTKLLDYGPTCVQRTPAGFVANFSGQSFYYTIDAAGTTVTKAASTALFASSDPAGDGTLWLLGANGLYISGTSNYHKVNGLTMTTPFWMKYNAAMDKLYVASSAKNLWYIKKDYNNAINTYDGADWKLANAYGTGTGYAGYEFVFDPFDPYTYVRASWTQGILKVTNDALAKQFTKSNSEIGTYKATPAFDRYGNLWAVSSYGYASAPVVVLPRAKFENPASVAKADWFVPSGLLNVSTGNMQASQFIISRKNNVKLYTDGDYSQAGPYVGHILCWDNATEDPKAGSYQFVTLGSFVDQNNKTVDWTYIRHMEEDLDGNIWVGTMSGLFYFDPDEVFNARPKAVRPFVTKFDEGTGNLCEGYEVYDIGVDADNNKWIATNGNGLFFVSPDGSEVFKHFTTDNSDIPGNVVYSVECDTVNNRVFIITDNGLAEYISDSDAAALDYGSVYALPNPVEPDYTGMVKISGLMEDTWLVITDSEGRVVKTMGPVTGSALWDASDERGERVATGIYRVYVAQGAQPAVDGEPAATVMVIK